MTCLFIVVGKYCDETWLGDHVDQIHENKFETYLLSFYFVGTTITTVGYGDYSPKCSEEKILGLFLMVVGVSAFGFLSGALSSFFSTTDSASAELDLQMMKLYQMKDEYNLSETLCKQIR